MLSPKAIHMPEKNDSCLAILKKYSLLVDFEGEAPMSPIKPAIEGETFGQWKKRLWGDDAPQVVVYTPTEPKPNKRMATLQREADVEHLKGIFRQLAKEQRLQNREIADETRKRTEERYSTISKDSLRDAAAELKGDLEPSVSEHLEHYLAKQPDDVAIEPLIGDLLSNYNNAVKLLHQREKDVLRLKQALQDAQERAE